jgi:hypothetical protein
LKQAQDHPSHPAGAIVTIEERNSSHDCRSEKSMPLLHQVGGGQRLEAQPGECESVSGVLEPAWVVKGLESLHQVINNVADWWPTRETECVDVNNLVCCSEGAELGDDPIFRRADEGLGKGF